MSPDRSDLIPVRALNQVSYCPRLYYLEYVESLMIVNEHVEDGLFAHRRVNDPELANRTRKEGDALRTRSVSIASDRLGISGKLDLLEEKGEAARPVEYKRSTAPRDADGAFTVWENDAIQLCAQRFWSRRAWDSRSPPASFTTLARKPGSRFPSMNHSGRRPSRPSR